MDPGTILAIIGTSTSVLKLIRSLYDSLHQSSYYKLQDLAERLETLQHVAEQLEQVEGGGEREFQIAIRAIKDCEEFLKSYKYGASEGSSWKASLRGAKLGVIDADKVEELHRRFDRAINTLTIFKNSLEDSLTRDRQAQRRPSVSEPRKQRKRGKSVYNNTERQDTSFTDTTYVDTTIPESSSSVKHPTNPWAAETQPLYFASYPSPRDDVPVIYEEPPTEDPDATLEQPYNALNIIDEGAYPESNAPPAQTQPLPYSCGRLSIKLLLKSNYEVFHFSGGYSVQQSDRHRIVEWANDHVTIWHYVPLDSKGVPYTRPDDKSKLDFLPPLEKLCKHWVNIRRNYEPDDVQGSPQNPCYSFTDVEDRDRFEEVIRACQSMIKFRALHVKGIDNNKLLSEDVDLKLWLPESEYDQPKLSFARNLLLEKDKKHDEYPLSLFQPLPKPSRSRSGVTYRIRIARQSISGAPVSTDERKHRRSSASSSIKRFSISSTSNARRPSTEIVSPGGASPQEAGSNLTIPSSLGRMGGFDIEFTKEVGIAFQRAWEELLQGGSSGASGCSAGSAYTGTPHSMSTFGFHTSTSYQTSPQSINYGQQSPLASSPGLSPLELPGPGLGDYGYYQPQR